MITIRKMKKDFEDANVLASIRFEGTSLKGTLQHRVRTETISMPDETCE